MDRRRYNRRKRILIAYALRTMVGGIFAGMIMLMICGGIYIYDLFHQDEDSEVSGTYVSGVDAEEEMDTLGSTNIQTQDEFDYPDDTENYEGTTIVLDAGHGGDDCGTYSGEIYEEDINLAIALRMKELLEEKGIRTILTRDTDEEVSLKDRVVIANQADADLFVSIHCNYYEDDSSISGLECYYFEGSENGQYHAENIVNELEERDNITVRNAKAEDFYVLRETDIPAVLIEVGYLSNYREAQKLWSDDYQDLMAAELVESILQSLVRTL